MKSAAYKLGEKVVGGTKSSDFEAVERTANTIGGIAAVAPTGIAALIAALTSRKGNKLRNAIRAGGTVAGAQLGAGVGSRVGGKLVLRSLPSDDFNSDNSSSALLKMLGGMGGGVVAGGTAGGIGSYKLLKHLTRNMGVKEDGEDMKTAAYDLGKKMAQAPSANFQENLDRYYAAMKKTLNQPNMRPNWLRRVIGGAPESPSTLDLGKAVPALERGYDRILGESATGAPLFKSNELKTDEDLDKRSRLERAFSEGFFEKLGYGDTWDTIKSTAGRAVDKLYEGAGVARGTVDGLMSSEYLKNVGSNIYEGLGRGRDSVRAAISGITQPGAMVDRDEAMQGAVNRAAAGDKAMGANPVYGSLQSMPWLAKLISGVSPEQTEQSLNWNEMGQTAQNVRSDANIAGGVSRGIDMAKAQPGNLMDYLRNTFNR